MQLVKKKCTLKKNVVKDGFYEEESQLLQKNNFIHLKLTKPNLTEYCVHGLVFHFMRMLSMVLFAWQQLTIYITCKAKSKKRKCLRLCQKLTP